MKSEIPNVTGFFDGFIDIRDASGVFITSNLQLTDADSKLDTHGYHGVLMDASRISGCYGPYTEVNPLYESTKYMIKY